MSLQVIIISLAESVTDPTSAWMPEFTRLDWMQVRAKSLKQAEYCIKSYPNAVVTMLMPKSANGSVDGLTQVRTMVADRQVIAIGVGAEAVCPCSLSQAGADFVLPSGAPFTLFQQLVESVREVARARAGDANGESARTLACQTRKLLHDINQPLAVLQGRIEILNMKASPVDGAKEIYTLLQEQAHKMSEIVGQLHELHRKYK